MLKLKPSELEPGMELARDIIIPQEKTSLLSRGIKLTPQHIEKIKRFGVTEVHIAVKPIALTERPRDKVFRESYQSALHKCKVLFDRILITGQLDAGLVYSISEKLLAELSLGPNILRYLRLISSNAEYTYSHSLNVSMVAVSAGRAVQYAEADLKQLAIAGLLHDIGRVCIPREILNKPGPLTAQEYEEIKHHPMYGYEIIQAATWLDKSVGLAVLQHHEREDGSGYPMGLTGSQIHPYAKVIAVADIFSAMTADRVYQQKTSHYAVADALSAASFGQVDSKITTSFLEYVSNFYVGNIVVLNTGETGEVIYINRDYPTRPIVRVGEYYVNLLRNPQKHIVDVLE